MDTMKAKSPKGWAKHVWATIHMVALGYPDQPTLNDREAYKTFYTNIGNVLPCPKCRMNFARHVTGLDVDGFLGSRKKLFEWTVYLHNSVNKDLGKPQWNVDFAWSFYEGGQTVTSHHGHFSRNIMIGLVMVNVIVLAFVVWKLRKT